MAIAVDAGRRRARDCGRRAAEVVRDRRSFDHPARRRARGPRAGTLWSTLGERIGSLLSRWQSHGTTRRPHKVWGPQTNDLVLKLRKRRISKCGS